MEIRYMKNATRFRNRMQKVMIIAFCWTLLVSLSFINEYFFVADLVDLKKLSGNYEFWPDFTGQVILGVFGGLVGGYLLVFKMDYRYKHKSFAYGIFNSGLLFVMYYLIIAAFGLFFMAFIYFSFKFDPDIAFHRSWNNLLLNIDTPSFFITMGMAGILVSATQFMLQVNDKFGPGILWKFITGKYYHPREEKRIFMFLDLKSSTTIAEKMGNTRYFELLKEIYEDITEPILGSLGEIYQYVGDEVVISWPAEKGLRGKNCLSCFFKIERTIEEKKEYYLEKYGHIPSFKAGLHLGEATVGEIGVIKKDIVFSGDVLNTTSRIQGKCNQYNVNILISSTLLECLTLNETYKSIPIGAISLRGKAEKVVLNTIKAV